MLRNLLDMMHKFTFQIKFRQLLTLTDTRPLGFGKSISPPDVCCLLGDYSGEKFFDAPNDIDDITATVRFD